MKFLTSTVAKLLYALPFAGFGLFHFMGTADMVEMLHPPGGAAMVYVSGVALIAAAVSIITGLYTKWACLGLALMMVLIVILLHIPNMNAADECLKNGAMPAILKDLSLAGAALFIAGHSEK